MYVFMQIEEKGNTETIESTHLRTPPSFIQYKLAYNHTWRLVHFARGNTTRCIREITKKGPLATAELKQLNYVSDARDKDSNVVICK